MVPDVVIDAAATVRPWKPPWKTMTFGLPVACRREPQRRLDGLAAGVGEEHPSRALRAATSPEPLGELLSSGLVHDGRVLRVDQSADLVLGRRDDPGVAVPGAGHADAGGEVEVAATVFFVQQDALSRAASTPVACLRTPESCADADTFLPLACSMGRLSTISVSGSVQPDPRRRRG